ncbi:DUF4440 domain-containing protein [Kribbella qitaiheensis]|uniref:DUF4440 domain-containing protein n=1 Tax=Kribbella qitaiheensis TaxID=1544730 RepID=UPI00362116F8
MVEAIGDTLQDEVYTISDVQWIFASPDCAVVRYRFRWVGYTNGERREGQGRGTNAMTKRNGRWQMIHEHLSGLGVSSDGSSAESLGFARGISQARVSGGPDDGVVDRGDGVDAVRLVQRDRV